jgi:hypothetical protein
MTRLSVGKSALPFPTSALSAWEKFELLMSQEPTTFTQYIASRLLILTTMARQPTILGAGGFRHDDEYQPYAAA